MPGFGSGSFGSGPFGMYDWARQVLWRDLPDIDRRIDAEQANGALEKWQESIMPLFEELLRFAYDFEQIRDPDSIRTKFQDVISVTINGSSIEQANRLIRVTVDDPDPSDPFVPLGRTSVGWILTDANGAEYTVNQVHKLSNAVIISGATFPALGDATLRPPSLIGYLGSDYGLSVDQHDPEVYQRSMVRNAFQWLSLKGTERAYDIIGKIAGYRVTPLGLWRLPSPPPSFIPDAHVFEAPLGSGKYYTDLDPAYPCFDEVAADIVPLDVMCWQELDWTTDGITPPIPPPADGTTVSEAIMSYASGLGILSTTSLGGGLWRIQVGGADLTHISSVGHWYADFTDVGSIDGSFFLEANPVDLGGGVWEFDVYAGTAPTFGTTLDIWYECHASTDCGWCRASVIRVEIVPQEILTDPEALLDHALERMVRKILLVVPIHVRLTDLIHIVGPAAANVHVAVGGPTTPHLYATATQLAALFAYGPVGYYYDIIPADEIAVDPSHIIASGTQFTIP